jgi:hypothetical protein
MDRIVRMGKKVDSLVWGWLAGLGGPIVVVVEVPFDGMLENDYSRGAFF